MLGILYILLCFILGYVLLSLMIPHIFAFMDKTYSGRDIDGCSLLLALPASFIAGALVMTWSTYFLAWIFNSHPDSLTYANAIVIPGAAVLSIAGLIFVRKYVKGDLSRVKRNFTSTELFVIALSLVIAMILMVVSFFYRDGKFYVGMSVFSDFSTHLDMIRSFSHGNNFPTWYSHYAGEDIKYHFMFQFFAGNLEYLGLRLDMAFNLPSIICFVSACMLLYSLAFKLFGKRSVGVISVLLFLFRSSASFGKYISGINGSFKEIFNTIGNNNAFIGSTQNEEWGLYNLNVYANQRHLAFGLSVLLLVIILLLPDLFDAVERIKETESSKIKEFMFCKEAWLPAKVRVPIMCGLFLGLASFWNGACVIGCLLVLFILAFACGRRLEYLITALIGVGFAALESRIFIKGSVFEFRWEPGYLAQVKTLFGTFEFICTLLGISVILTLMASVMVNGWFRYILLAFMSPVIFALCFQLTPDVSVNHKYIMMGYMLVTVFLAAMVYRLFSARGVYKKAVAILLLCMLTVTGFYDFTVFIRRNASGRGGCITFDSNDPVTNWVMDNSDSRDIWLTDWYSLNNVVIGGAMLYYGWPYYAWSAGYDTNLRQAKTYAMYQAEDPETLIQMVNEENIRFIVVDNAARTNENYHVNEANIASCFECVYSSGEGEHAFNIYDVQKQLN